MNPAPICRSCGQAGLKEFLSLGRTPLANSFLEPDRLDQPEPRFPLDLAFCPACTLVQIVETVPPEVLFREYLYLSSFSDTMLQHARSLAQKTVEARRLDASSLVVEAASNDGYLLQYYRGAGVGVLGVEPARNIAAVARQRGIPTISEFFGVDLAEQFRARGQFADVVHAHNVLAHVPDLNGFVRGIRLILKDNGVAILEAPYAKDLIDQCQFDTIYHEHLCYFSLTAIARCLERHDLRVAHVERVPIHGGSLQVHAVPCLGNREHGASALALLEEERAWGVDSLDAYLSFAKQVTTLKETLCSLLGDLKRRGKRVAAYGASAKGSTLLNYCGIGKDILDFVVDRNPAKQGRFTPGSHLPIYGPEKLLEDLPDYALLLTWNFAEEIMAQQQAYRNRGGRFIRPIPEVKVA